MAATIDLSQFEHDAGSDDAKASLSLKTPSVKRKRAGGTQPGKPAAKRDRKQAVLRAKSSKKRSSKSAKSAKSAAAAEQDDDDVDDDDDDAEEEKVKDEEPYYFQQAHMHNWVRYKSRKQLGKQLGRKLEDPHQASTFAKIEEHYVIPVDIESTDYGPHSGSSFEERVLSTYAWGMLKPKDTRKTFADRTLKFCDACGKSGHTRFQCDEE